MQLNCHLSALVKKESADMACQKQPLLPTEWESAPAKDRLDTHQEEHQSPMSLEPFRIFLDGARCLFKLSVRKHDY
jgi:hypothetical protein